MVSTKTKKVVISTAIILFLGLVITLKVCILDNVHSLCIIAEGAGSNTSSLYYLAIERIYKLAERKEVGEALVVELDGGRNVYSYGLYRRLLGVIGEDAALTPLLIFYADNQDNEQSAHQLHITIISLGLLGNEDAVPILEAILTGSKERPHVEGVTVARSLYLLTGKSYEFTYRGNKQDLYVNDELREARKVILAAKRRKRNFEEMITLDMLFRPSSE